MSSLSRSRPASQPLTSKRWLNLAVSLLPLALAACGGDSGSGSSGGSVTVPVQTPTPTPGPTPSPSPTPTPTPIPTPPTATSTATSWATVANLYDTQPNRSSCAAGTLKANVQADMLAFVNYVRALHSLPAVTYYAGGNQSVQESSLMQAAANTLNHTPPTSWDCYTTAGFNAAKSSNLIGGWGTGLGWSSESDLLAGWMTERNSASIGHRRWLLDPFLGQISYGRVAYVNSGGSRADAATMKVFDFPSNPTVAPSSIPNYVAYPQGNYPAKYFGAGDILSFSVVANKSGRFGNGSVSFANATITVQAGSTSLPVTGVAPDNFNYGLPNNIEWRVTGLQNNTDYTVTISGVTGAPQTSYTYNFKIVS